MSRSLAVLILILMWAPALHAAPDPRRAEQARSLHDRAVEQLKRGSIDHRRLAIRNLTQATLLDPDNPTYHMALGRIYYDAGFFMYARQSFERVIAMAPNDPESRHGLGEVWKYDWLKYLDEKSLWRAVINFDIAARMAPETGDHWLSLVPLLIEQGRLESADSAAAAGLAADPRRAELMLASAHTSYKLGRIDQADRSFKDAIPRLSKIARERFEDIAPVATERDTALLSRMSPREQREFIRRFWKDIDPDLATPENEAQLEYWSRVAQAYFLFFNAKRQEWDLRGEIYVRYGPPTSADYNPLGANLRFQHGVGVSFPMNMLVWYYPHLGMTVELQDRFLSQNYLLPVNFERDPDPRPNPDSVYAHSDRIATRMSRGVFPALPPGVEPMPVDGVIAHFQGDELERLVTQIEARGGPADSMWAQWVVLDSSLNEIYRESRMLSPSACDPVERRVADFATMLEPGDYRVGLTVHDRWKRRGLYRTSTRITKLSDRLDVSDLVVTCGVPDAASMAATRVVRIEPNPGAVVEGPTLTAYFEIYNLRPDGSGQSRFEYIYTVRSAEKDNRVWIQRLLAPRKRPAPISVRRRGQNPGDMRRQFVTVPVSALPRGKYTLEIRVRDIVAGRSTVQQTDFVKVGPGGS